LRQTRALFRHHGILCRDRQPLMLECFADIGAGADARLDQPLGGELIEAFHDGGAGDLEFVGEGAGRRQSPAGLERTGQDELAQMSADLDAEAVRGLAIDGDRLQ